MIRNLLLNVEEEDVPVIPLVSTKIQYNTSYEDMNVISQKDDGTAKISSNGTTSGSKNPPDESKGKEDVATESATTQQPFTGLNCSFGSSSSSESETTDNSSDSDSPSDDESAVPKLLSPGEKSVDEDSVAREPQPRHSESKDDKSSSSTKQHKQKFS